MRKHHDFILDPRPGRCDHLASVCGLEDEVGEAETPDVACGVVGGVAAGEVVVGALCL
jgi:hypothetical protein